MKRHVPALVAGIAIASFASVASAQYVETPTPTMIPAPKNAFEIQIGGGYSQGTGRFTDVPGQRISDAAGPGGSVDLSLGARATENWYFGAYGSYSQFSRSDLLSTGTAVRGATAGLEGQYHVMPNMMVDPWVGIGAGYRMIDVSPDLGPDTVYHGLQLARVRAGLDFRVSRGVALGPVVGADWSMFLWQKAPGQTTTAIRGEDISNSVFFFAGLQGRFDAVSGATSATGVASR